MYILTISLTLFTIFIKVMQLCTKYTLFSAEHGLHNWLNTRPGGKDDIASMSLIDNDDNGSLILLDQSVCIEYT